MKQIDLTIPKGAIFSDDMRYRYAHGGLLTVHLKDGSVDFIIDNWCG